MKYTEALQMRKTADGGVINDALGNAITVGATMPLGGIGGLASLGGTIAGLAAGPAKEKDLNKMDKRPAYSYIPGVGAYRLARKQLAAVDNSRPRSTLLSEMAGPLTSSVAPALVGAGLGAAFGGQPGAAIGALAGGAASGGATLLGNLIGMARRRRTDMERGIEDEEESRLANLLVPGVAGYRTGRRALDAYDDEVKRNEWNEAEREVNAQIAEQDKDDKEQKKEAGLHMYTAALQMRKQAEAGEAPTPYSDAKSRTEGVLTGMVQRPYAVQRIVQDIAEPVVGRLAELQEKRDQIQRDRFYGGLTAGVGVGGLTAAGTYGLTGLVPGLKNSKFLRWLLAGTAGGVAGLQAGRFGADASNVQHLA